MKLIEDWINWSVYMKQRIFTGSYDKCKKGNLISISGDRGRSVGFNGKALPQLAPKRNFWNIWYNQIGKVSEEENTKYYIEQYYRQVLSNRDIMQIIKDENDPILLCFEDSSQFCHRHILAEYINIKYGLEVHEIEVTENLEIIQKDRPGNIRKILEQVIEQEQERD